MRYLLFFILIGVVPCKAQAQMKEVALLEFPMDMEQDAYVPLSLETEGILLYRELETKHHSRILELTRLDTTLVVAWRGMLNLKNNSTCMGAKVFEDHIWMLFRNEKAPFDYQVYSIQVKVGRYEMFNIDERDAFTPLNFTVGKNFFLIGGAESKRSVFLYYSFAEHRSHLLSGFAAIESELNEVTCDEQGNIEIVLITKEKHQRGVLILTFNPEGEMISQLPIQSPSHDFYFARLVHSSGNKKLLFGTYQKTKTKTDGIFSVVLNAESQANIKYYDFGQLKHFYQGSGEMNLKRKKPTHLKHTLYLQKPVEEQGHFRVIANLFRPIINRFVQSYQGRPSSIASARLDSSQFRPEYAPLSGFAISRSVMLNFNHEGELVNDDSFPLKNSYSQQLDQVVHTLNCSGNTSFVTIQSNQVVSKMVVENHLVSKELWRPVVKNTTPGVERKISLREFHPWYKNYSFCTGLISNAAAYVPVPNYQFTVRKLKMD